MQDWQEHSVFLCSTIYCRSWTSMPEMTLKKCKIWLPIFIERYFNYRKTHQAVLELFSAQSSEVLASNPSQHFLRVHIFWFISIHSTVTESILSVVVRLGVTLQHVECTIPAPLNSTVAIHCNTGLFVYSRSVKVKSNDLLPQSRSAEKCSDPEVQRYGRTKPGRREHVLGS